MSSVLFERVLIANRGEIARRVMRTCRRLGIATVAVYSDADVDALHVADADRAVRLGPPPASESYLDVEAVVDAAVRSGADALHPGYGFLSENAALPEACDAAGIVFVGPRPDTIRLMGDKAAAKTRLAQAGVPVVPGVDRDDLDDEALADAVRDLGAPALIKAVAGGGGKGMRAVHDVADLPDAIRSARREAAGAFGDDRLIAERLVERPRHVEIQVFGDAHGRVLHLLERECSIQRRHQKVVEEAPSPAVDPDLRRRMGEAACDAAAAVDYLGAGTVEFILAPDGAFYFLEMNTRLQVEHPVTELVTGLDLVELQLRVAAGRPLELEQASVEPDGHAIEVRVYAEDAAGGFLPQTGVLDVVGFPEDVRVDAGVASGDAVPRFYDPMLAKIIVHGPDRATAVSRIRRAVAETELLGVTTNIEFLGAVVGDDAFAAGDLDTGFLDRRMPDWSPEPLDADVLAVVAAALAEPQPEPARASAPGDVWDRLGPWRHAGVGGWIVRLTTGDHEHTLEVGAGGDRALRVSLDGADRRVVLRRLDAAGRIEAEVGDRTLRVRIHRDGDEVWVHADGINRRLRLEPATRHGDPTLLGGASFTSPMPGSVLSVDVEAGDEVAEGATLVVVEAMKMEHPVTAPTDGVVAEVLVGPGDPVEADQPLLVFEPKEST